MPKYPSPTPKELKTAFNDFGVNWIEHRGVSNGRDAWANGLRAATVHHTAGKNSADYLSSFNYGGANVCINNGQYNGNAVDGRAVIISWGSAWHSGAGGPWKGVAGKDSLHLVSWGIEIESMGNRRDITEKQQETVGRMLAALVDLGMPIDHIHRHADWTDGTGPVGGYPLPTKGRKVDTNKNLGYTTEHWVEQAKLYVPSKGLWDGKIPTLQAAMESSQNPERASSAAWRLACRLYDLGHYVGRPLPRYEQKYPRKAVAAFQIATSGQGTGEYGPKTHAALFGKP